MAKKAPFEKTVLDLKSVIADVLALARYESATRRVMIITDCPKSRFSFWAIACNFSRSCSTWSAMAWMQ